MGKKEAASAPTCLPKLSCLEQCYNLAQRMLKLARKRRPLIGRPANCLVRRMRARARGGRFRLTANAYAGMFQTADTARGSRFRLAANDSSSSEFVERPAASTSADRPMRMASGKVSSFYAWLKTRRKERSGAVGAAEKADGAA